ncbi:MAG: hypothetical protein IKQ17_04390 [Kiritimatiellae bacterium]|nr:hypothetical protein [Kiritimatiellia bacterium]
MKPYSANVWDTLIEALHLYWQVLKDKWPVLLAIIVPSELLMALYRFAVASISAGSLTHIKSENVVTSVLGMTIGLVAVAITVDHAFFKCTGQRRPAEGGIAAAWGRMMATELLRTIAQIAMVVAVAVTSSVALSIAIAAPLAQLGGSASVLVGIVAVIMLAPLIALIVWIVVRWSFAVVLSAIQPAMGTTALGESWRFVRDRAARCIFLLIAASLVAAGISAIPNSLATCYARGEILGLPALPGTVLTRTAALFLGGIITSFAGLFLTVAMMTFWVRTVEPCELPEHLRRGHTGSLVAVLLVLGALAYAFGVFFGAKASMSANEEMRRKRSEKNVEMIEALKGRLREESVVHALPDAYKEDHVRMENGELVVDSPFDLCIGSTECAKLLGAKLNSSTFGTNQYHFACARLAKPYFGCKWLSLNFRGAEHALGSIYLGNDNPTLDDCRKTVRGIADDIGQRFGVKMEPTLDITDEQALDRNKRLRPRSDNSRCLCEFLTYQARMDNGHEIVQYCVNGMVDSKTKALSARLSIRAEGK